MTATIPGSNSAEGNRPPRVDIPNGMHTAYTYDTSGRQDSIHHKDGTTIVQGFDYTFDNGSNITKITHEDGAYWAYDYDGRDRLIEAERYDATPSLLHRYTYTYDDGNNMLTKAVYDAATTNTATTTFTYNGANEQITMSDGSSTTSMTYDTWGRLIGKGDGTYTATYAYRYGSKLYSVASNFPGEGNVTYETGADGKRRSRVAGLEEAWYNYTVGFDVVSTENDADGSTGALTMTNVVIAPTATVSATLADLAGTNPSTGTSRYYATDHLGSTRSIWDASKTAIGTYEFASYGSEYNYTGAALDILAGAYTGKPWYDTAKLFHFPFRQYSPDLARWTIRDPLGMVDGPNMYGYVSAFPVNRTDPLGLLPIDENGEYQWPWGSPQNPGPRPSGPSADVRSKCIAIWAVVGGDRSCMDRCMKNDGQWPGPPCRQPPGGPGSPSGNNGGYINFGGIGSALSALGEALGGIISRLFPISPFHDRWQPPSHRPQPPCQYT